MTKIPPIFMFLELYLCHSPFLLMKQFNSLILSLFLKALREGVQK